MHSTPFRQPASHPHDGCIFNLSILCAVTAFCLLFDHRSDDTVNPRVNTAIPARQQHEKKQVKISPVCKSISR